MRTWIMLLSLLAGLYASTVVMAANPADLTSFHRPCDTFHKAAYDGGEWWVSLSQSVEKGTTLTYYHWDGGEIGVDQIYAGKAITPNLDVATSCDWWRGSVRHFRQDAVLDVHTESVAMGIMVPMQRGEYPGLGPRAKLGEFTFLSTLRHQSHPLWGVDWHHGSTIVNAAYGRGTWHVRTQREVGQFWPELRWKSGGNGFLGFALGYAP